MAKQQSEQESKDRALRTLVSFAASKMEDYESGDLEQRLSQVSKDTINRFEIRGPLTKVEDGAYKIKVYDQYGGRELEVALQDNNLETLSREFPDYASEYVTLAKQANESFESEKQANAVEERMKKTQRGITWKKRALAGGITSGIMGALFFGINGIHSYVTSPEFKARTAKIQEESRKRAEEETQRLELAKQLKEEQEEIAKKALFIQPRDAFLHRYNLDGVETFVYQQRTPSDGGFRLTIEKGSQRFMSEWYGDFCNAPGDIENLDKYQRKENGIWKEVEITDTERKSYNELINQISASKEE